MSEPRGRVSAASLRRPGRNRLEEARAHARILARVAEELQSCPTEQIAYDLATTAIHEELELAFGACWRITGAGLIELAATSGADGGFWLADGPMPTEGPVAEAFARETVVDASVEGATEDCCLIAMARDADAPHVVAIPVFGRAGTVRVIALLGFGLREPTLTEERREALELLGQLVSNAMIRICDQRVLMESNACNFAVTKVLEDTARARSAEELSQRSVSIVRDQFGWLWGAFWKLDPHRGVYELARADGDLGEALDEAARADVVIPGVGVAGRVAEDRRIVDVRDLCELEGCSRIMPALDAGATSGVGLPIFAEGQTVGVLEFFAAEPIELSPEREQALEAISALLSQAFQRLLDVDQQMDEARKARALAELHKVLGATRTSEEAAEVTVGVLSRSFGVTLGVYWRLREGALVFDSASGPLGPTVGPALQDHRLSLEDEGFVARSLDERAATVGLEVPEGPLAAAATEAELVTHFSLPLTVEEAPLGVITVHRPRGVTGSPDDLAILTTVSELTSATIGRIRQDRKVARYGPMVEKTPTALALADRRGRLVFVNETGNGILDELADHLPVPRDRVVGSSLVELHRELIGEADVTDPSQLPLRGRMSVGPAVMQVTISALSDDEGRFIGPMVSWDDVTREVARERALEESRQHEAARQEELRAGVAAVLSVVERAEQGDLTCEVPDCGRGEIAEVAEGIRSLLEKLRASMAAVGELAGDLESNAHRLSTVAERVSGNARSTLDNVHSASSGVGEVTSGIESVTRGARDMASSVMEVSRHASEAAEVGAQAMDIAGDAGGKIERLGKSSAEIGMVMRTINAIAEQTKLLALNATIEAARAGEAGRGFGVVANEVKNLARETADATTDIASRIETIQGDTSEVVEAIDRIREVITSITDKQRAIAGAVEGQSATTEAMSRSSGASAETIASVSTSTQGVVGMAEDTVSASEEAKRAAAELRETSERLAQTLGRFTF